MPGEVSHLSRNLCSPHSPVAEQWGGSTSAVPTCAYEMLDGQQSLGLFPGVEDLGVPRVPLPVLYSQAGR